MHKLFDLTSVKGYSGVTETKHQEDPKMSYSEITPAAFHALKAADIRARCGRYAAAAYARKHGVSGLYRLALQLRAVA